MAYINIDLKIPSIPYRLAYDESLPDALTPLNQFNKIHENKEAIKYFTVSLVPYKNLKAGTSQYFPKLNIVYPIYSLAHSF